MNGLRLGRVARGLNTLRGAWKVVALTLLAGAASLVGLLATTLTASSDQLVARVGNITVEVTALRVGPTGSLTGILQVETNGQSSDQLDAAIAEGGTPVALYHNEVNVGEILDLASCDGQRPSTAVINHWLHYGPLLVPGRSGGSSPPAQATMTVSSVKPMKPDASLSVTLYFAHAGSVTISLPVEHV